MGEHDRMDGLDATCGVTAGMTADGEYSLVMQNYCGRPCMVLHRCEKREGLNYSSMDRSSFVAAVDLESLKMAVRLVEDRPYMFVSASPVDEGNGLDHMNVL